MKPARIFLWLAAGLLALLAWWYWPAASSSSPTGATKIPPAKGADNQPLLKAVEPPKAAPAQPAEAPSPIILSPAVNSANATILEANRQETMDGLLQFQTALEQSLGNTTNPQDRDALEHELTQLQLQIQYDISHSATAPSAITNLGEIALAEGQVVRKKLASGDEATLTASISANGNWSVTVIVRHTDASLATAVESTSIVVRPGQPAVIKTPGNAIHFTLKTAGNP